MPTHAPMHESAHTEFSSSKVYSAFLQALQNADVQPGCRSSAGETNRPLRARCPCGRSPLPRCCGRRNRLEARFMAAAALLPNSLIDCDGLCRAATVGARLCARLRCPAVRLFRGGRVARLGCCASFRRRICRSDWPGLLCRRIRSLASFTSCRHSCDNPHAVGHCGTRLGSEPYFASYLGGIVYTFASFSLQLPVLKLQPIWYLGSRPGQRLFACGSAVWRTSPNQLPSRPARLRGPGQILQFPVDDILDERHVVHDREMGALPDVDLQT